MARVDADKLNAATEDSRPIDILVNNAGVMAIPTSARPTDETNSPILRVTSL